MLSDAVGRPNTPMLTLRSRQAKLEGWASRLMTVVRLIIAHRSQAHLGFMQGKGSHHRAVLQATCMQLLLSKSDLQPRNSFIGKRDRTWGS